MSDTASLTTADAEAFRERCREFLSEHAKPGARRDLAAARAFQAALADAGLAGLTYDTIPPSPWARGVRSVLEHDFRANPHGSTADRVREHYLAYHSAHGLVGCTGGPGCARPPAPASP